MSLHTTRDILSELTAENLLLGSHILTQISELRESLQQKSNGDVISYDDYYERIQKELDELPRLELKLSVAPGTENQYIANLISSLDQINGDCNRVQNRTAKFLSKLKSAQSEAKKLAASFGAWYILAATDVVTEHNLKLAQPLIKSLAESEFSRLMGGINTEVESLMVAVSIQMEQAKEHKKTQSEKFKLGEKQAHSSILTRVPNFGGFNSGPNDTIVQDDPEPDEEDIPDYVSRKPIQSTVISWEQGPSTITVPSLSNSVFISNSEGFSTLENLNIKPTFMKYGDAVPTQIVNEEELQIEELAKVFTGETDDEDLTPEELIAEEKALEEAEILDNIVESYESPTENDVVSALPKFLPVDVVKSAVIATRTHYNPLAEDEEREARVKAITSIEAQKFSEIDEDIETGAVMPDIVYNIDEFASTLGGVPVKEPVKISPKRKPLIFVDEDDL